MARRCELVRLQVHSGDDDPYQNDVVSHRGKAVGLVRTGGFGHLSGTGLAFAVIPAALATANTDARGRDLWDIAPGDGAAMAEQRDAAPDGIANPANQHCDIRTIQ